MVNKKARSLGLIGGQSIFGIIFILLIIAAADKSDLKADWSMSGTYSLHPATERICANIKEPISIYGVWSKTPDRGTRESAILRNQKSVVLKLKQIAEMNEHIDFEFVDNVVDKPRLKELEKELGTVGKLNVYLRNKSGKQIKVPYGPYFDRKLENNIGSALLALQQEKQIAVSLLAGHGELKPRAESHDSIGHLLNVFNSSGIRTEILDPVSLSKLGRIPQDTILFIPGPRSTLGEETIKHIDTFLQAGGNALILADVSCPNDLSALLRKRGVMVGNGIIPRPQDLSFLNKDAKTSAPRVILSSEHAIIGKDSRYDRLSVIPSPQHPVSMRSHDAGSTILCPYSSFMLPMFPDRYEQVFPNFKQHIQSLGTNPYSINPILMISGPQIWDGDVRDARVYQEQTQAIDAHIGISIRYHLGEDSVSGQKESRLVVFSSRGMAADAVTSQSKYANELLFVDAISWLGFNENSSEIPTASFKELQINCSEGTLTALLYILVIIVPMSCLGLAILMWWDRR